jgi:hypothetical protein
MQITGILKLKKDEQEVSSKFRKREFILTDNSSSQYPQHILFQLTQDKCNLIDSVREGDNIVVHFNLRGREWTSPQGEIKYFNTLEAWKIEKQGGAAPVEGRQPESSFADAPIADKDDLPF